MPEIMPLCISLFDYAVQRMMLVAPPSVQVSSPGFMPAGTEQGYNVYTRDAVPLGATFDVAIAGTAPLPPAADQGSGDANASQAPDAQAQDQGQDQVNGRSSGPTIQTMPDRLDSLKWILIGGFAALFALGLLMLWRRPGLAVAGGPAEVAAIPERARIGSQGQTAPAVPSTTVTSAAQAPSASDVDRQVEQGLDGLKDKLFRLELRHQAGTISEEEYAAERALAEKTLRDLVQG